MDDLEVEEILAEPNERTWFFVLSSGKFCSYSLMKGRSNFNEI